MSLKNLFTPKPDGSNSVDAINARIATERESLASEELNEASLTAERQLLMQDVDASDSDIDNIERRMGDSRGAQLRKIERIATLQERLAIATEKEQQSALDAQEKIAERCRVRGVDLIARYAKLAPAVAAVVAEMQVTSGVIEQINATLVRAGRKPVQDGNAVRCRPEQHIDFEEKITVFPSDEKHPMFGKTCSIDNNRGGPVRFVSNDGTEVLPVEITVQRRERISGEHHAPLHDTVNLPTAEPIGLSHHSAPKRSPLFYWQAKHPHEYRRAEQERIDSLMQELGLSSNSKAA